MKRKILAAFILALAAIISALTITHFSFREVMVTVDDLSAPNQKITKLNKVFEEIATLDQQQRAEAIENPEKPYKYFLDQSSFLHMMIDSLQMLPWDTVQLKRLSSLHAILDQRNELFVSYMKVKAELANNREFSHQLDTLSLLLRENQLHADSSVITTEKKTITYLKDSVQAAKTDKGFFKRLFGKRKPKPEEDAATSSTTIQEELNVKIDTLAVAKQGINLMEIDKIIKDLERDQKSQRSKLQRKELELINANSLFINQLLNTLHEVQNEELQIMRASNQHASQVVTRGISRMNLLMIAFFLGAAVLIYLILIDISRSNYYKKQLEKARDRAEELSLIKQRFLANMSHEIRTPLQSIIGFAEQLKHSAKGEEVAAIHSSSEHLLQIVNEVLDYSRISSGTFTLATENFKLLQVICEVESAMKIQSGTKKLDLIVDTQQCHDLNLVGDAFRLRQILYNLIGNAIKFTYRGFVKLSVSTEEANDHAIVKFEVTDSGIGMSADEVQKIFNQFEQANTDIARKYGGTGLGLSIVKALVDVHHGEIHVQSQPGAGSTFTATLKYQKADGAAVSQAAPKQHNTFDEKSKVIVVDDDAMILKLCSIILRKHNIRHETVSDVDDLVNREPDADVSHFFIDIRMPKINGTQLCNVLRKKYPERVRFVALTAHVLPEERASLLKEGFDKVLTKPFHESAMLEVLGYTNTVEKPEVLPDLDLVRKMTMGDESLFQSVMKQFVSETGDDLNNLTQASAHKDQNRIREIVHKLAGRFGQMGISELGAKFREIEYALVDDQPISLLMDDINLAKQEAVAIVHAIRHNTLEQVN